MSAQSINALARANEVKYARVRIKRALRDGTTTLSDALRHEATQTMAIDRLLICIPNVGRYKAAKVLGGLGITANRPIQLLTERQLSAIVEALA